MKNSRQQFKHSMIATVTMMALLTLTACKSQMSFIPTAAVDPTAQDDSSGVNDFFKLSESEQTITQESLEENQTAISFQVRKPDGSLLQTLNASDLLLLESVIPVNKYTLTKNSLETKETVDIAFVVDVTGSMSATIESAKIRLINFVRRSREAGYHTRMCLVTFGDYTVRKCDKFYDNNPNDPSTNAQVDELISEITKLKALKGASDPGGSDLNENPMRALIDTASAAWATNNKRFAILITDDGFLYSPGNSGAVGSLAPQYAEVKAALANSKVKVFAATPSLAGYNKNFGSEQGIVSLSQGEWFNFADLISGAITLDTILNRILTNVNTTFTISYVADKIPGLNPSLSLALRQFQLQLLNPLLGTIQSLQFQSNLPDGRSDYKSEFGLSSKKIKKDSLKVIVNGMTVVNGFKLTTDGKIKFDQAPLAGSVIKVSYVYEKIKDAISLKPIILGQALDPKSVVVLLNGTQAKSKDYTIEKTIEGRYVVNIQDSALDDTDPYKIFANNGLHFDIKFK
ncbi:hypothetical protein CIK05_14140 [Bdellovibrio sp. qaytius]|nr:hypothetical protein CIK05_14140 [Bdellovibrio sp. qaytius]